MPVPTQWTDTLDADTINKILEIISEKSKIEQSFLVPGATMESLAIPSLDMVELLFEVEEKFNIYMPMGDELAGAVYLADIVAVMGEQIRTGATGPAQSN
jgi:acyl carrier protein